VSHFQPHSWHPHFSQIALAIGRSFDAGGEVRETAISETQFKKDWTLTESALGRFLCWLDEGIDSGGERYLEMRQRLVSYFDRKNCLSPDELTDETLNRVARRLEEEGDIPDTPARYCYIVAKFVFLEYLRRAERESSLDELPIPKHPALNPSISDADEPENKEVLLECLESCLANLEPDSRELISQYYLGEQRAKIDNRRALAARLKLTMNALSIRACRIRSKLEDCVKKCSAGK
jgi:DNA-directed RNA polymerase specialized sigma24 family protein